MVRVLTTRLVPKTELLAGSLHQPRRRSTTSQSLKPSTFPSLMVMRKHSESWLPMLREQSERTVSFSWRTTALALNSCTVNSPSPITSSTTFRKKTRSASCSTRLLDDGLAGSTNMASRDTVSRRMASTSSTGTKNSGRTTTFCQHVFFPSWMRSERSLRYVLMSYDR